MERTSQQDELAFNERMADAFRWLKTGGVRGRSRIVAKYTFEVRPKDGSEAVHFSVQFPVTVRQKSIRCEHQTGPEGDRRRLTKWLVCPSVRTEFSGDWAPVFCPEDGRSFNERRAREIALHLFLNHIKQPTTDESCAPAAKRVRYARLTRSA